MNAVRAEYLKQSSVSGMSVIDGDNETRASGRALAAIRQPYRLCDPAQIRQMRGEHVGFRIVVHEDQDPISPKQVSDGVNHAAPQETSGNDLLDQPYKGDTRTGPAHFVFLARACPAGQQHRGVAQPVRDAAWPRSVVDRAVTVHVPWRMTAGMSYGLGICPQANLWRAA